jgi:UDP-N-acetylglucosamine 2-epimerase (non-hydrolysing)
VRPAARRAKVLVVLGTRPEAIKLAPVISALRARPATFETVVCSTAQHREMLRPVLDLFAIEPDVDLDLMQANQQLPALTARILESVTPVLQRVRPDWLVVQGDTTTVAAASLAAYYERVAVAHVEAGLRTYDKYSPFPEEINRRMVTVLADLHFAPTKRARRALLDEGVQAGRIVVTGNTVVDAALECRKRLRQPSVKLRVLERLRACLPACCGEGLSGRWRSRMVLVTGHRRENFGEPLRNLCLALADLLQQNPDLHIIYPVHMNPNVRDVVHRFVSTHGLDRLHLTDPLDYSTFLFVLDRAHFVMTDSGGVQEEAPSFHKPLLILRDVTERPECVEVGAARLVGTDRRRIVQEASVLLGDGRRYRRMAEAGNPFGDGRAARRIVDRLQRETAR